MTKILVHNFLLKNIQETETIIVKSIQKQCEQCKILLSSLFQQMVILLC